MTNKWMLCTYIFTVRLSNNLIATILYYLHLETVFLHPVNIFFIQEIQKSLVLLIKFALLFTIYTHTHTHLAQKESFHKFIVTLNTTIMFSSLKLNWNSSHRSKIFLISNPMNDKRQDFLNIFFYFKLLRGQRRNTKWEWPQQRLSVLYMHLCVTKVSFAHCILNRCWIELK